MALQYVYPSSREKKEELILETFSIYFRALESFDSVFVVRRALDTIFLDFCTARSLEKPEHS